MIREADNTTIALCVNSARVGQVVLCAFESALSQKPKAIKLLPLVFDQPLEYGGERYREIQEEKGCGQEKVTYRLRDWLFSRQRYWGEPIPIIHWEDGTSTAVPETELPLVLPVTKDIRPSGTGESPLANLTDWHSL